MFAQKVGMYGLLFCIFFVIIGLLLDMPISKRAMKVCKGNEKVATIIVHFVVGLLAYALVKLIGSPIVDFLDMLFHTKFQRV